MKDKKQPNLQVGNWEHPNCPSGELELIFVMAEKLRRAEQAPSVRLDHFLLATILELHPTLAKDVLKVYEMVRDKWQKD